jgi:Cu/Ag efflux protein CusF
MIRVVFLLALLVALPGLGCGGAPEAGSRGVVVSVDAAKGEVTLDHEDIPGLMKAMTMTFQADPALLASVETGDQVEFRVRHAGGRYELTAISPSP